MVSKQIVRAAHGSGGKDSADLMEAIFAKHFKSQSLARLEDAAVIEVDKGRIATSTDTFVVTPLFFPGGNIGKLAACGTINDVLMMGAIPKYLTCGFVLEEGLEIDLLEEIVKSLALEAERAGVEIVAGDTKVIEGSGGLLINTTGIGFIPAARNLGADSLQVGDKIILSGNLGDHHATIMSSRMGISNNIKSDCAVLSEVTEALLDYDVRAMRDVTRGGLGTVLNEFARSSKIGISVNEKSLPLNEQVANLAGLLGLDPLYMANEGKLIAFVPGENANEALASVRATELGKNAVIIGEVVDLPDNQEPRVTMVTRMGGTRKIDMLYGEGLPRIC